MIDWLATIRCYVKSGKRHQYQAVRRYKVQAGPNDLKGAAQAGYALLLAEHPEAVAWRIDVTRLTPFEQPQPTQTALHVSQMQPSLFGDTTEQEAGR